MVASCFYRFEQTLFNYIVSSSFWWIQYHVLITYSTFQKVFCSLGQIADNHNNLGFLFFLFLLFFFFDRNKSLFSFQFKLFISIIILVFIHYLYVFTSWASGALDPGSSESGDLITSVKRFAFYWLFISLPFTC